MDAQREELIQLFKSYSDDELIDRCHFGDIAEPAQEIARAELRERGIDIDAIAGLAEEGADGSRVTAPADLETVAQFSRASEAHILRAMLEGDGIPAVIPDEHLGNANDFLLSAAGGVRVQVPRDFVGQAREIMQALKSGEMALAASDDDAEDAAEPLSLREQAFAAFTQDKHWLDVWRGLIAKTGVWGGFNVFAFVFGMNWFFFRKMYGVGLLVFVLDAAAFFSFGYLALLLYVRVPVGFVANLLYYLKAEKAVRGALAANLPKDSLLGRLRAQGGINFGAAMFGALLNILLTLFLAAWLR